MDLSTLLDPRVLLVTGKGGVGKSTVAATLALAGARTGRRTCLVEVEGRQTMARLFDSQPWDFTEREYRPGLHGISIDPEESLLEYLDLFYGAGRISKLLVGSSAVEFATTAAPGVRDVLLIGKVKEIERRRNPDGRFRYDLVVVDAPPTGRIVRFLGAPEAAIELVRMGPIRHQAQDVVDMLLDADRTRVQLVTLLEEMPVQETIEGIAALRDLGIAVGPLVLNRVRPDRLGEAAKALEALTPAKLRKRYAAVGLALGTAAAGELRALGEAHRERLALQERMRATLAAKAGLPMLALPERYAADFGFEELTALAAAVEGAVA